MEVTECQVLETALQNGVPFKSLFEDAEDEDTSEDEENDENWENVLPVEVKIETVEENSKPSQNSESDEDFYGFEDGEIPLKQKMTAQKFSLSKRSNVCPYCSYQTHRKDHFKRHVIRHPEQTLYPFGEGGRKERQERTCSVCGYSTSRLDHFKRHVMRHTGEKPYSCACGYSTTHRIHLKRHVLRLADPNTHYSLANVTKETGTPALMEILVKKPNTNKVSISKQKVKTHRKNVLKESLPFTDEPPSDIVPEKLVMKEGFGFSTSKESTLHHLNRIIDKPVSSIIKGISQIREENLTNGDVGPEDWGVGLWPVEVKLEEGNKSVSDDENEGKKRKRRRGGPHICEVCGYSTMRGDHFKRHLMRHTGEKPYSCSVCDYRSTHAIHLKRHMSIHTDDRPWHCSFCSFRAIRPHHLRDHIRLHTGERPYVCHLCGFSAAQSGNYRTHMRTHSGDKPFTCELCGYSTVKNSNLVSHMKVHRGEKGHKCQYCDYRAIKMSDTVRHTQRVHNIALS